MKYIIMSALWIGFGVVHSLLISVRFTDWLKKVTGRFYAFYRLVYNLVSLAAFLPLAEYVNKIDRTVVIGFGYPWNVVQYLLVGTAYVIFIVAFFSYEPLEFLGLRQAADFFSEGRAVKKKPGVVRSGLLGIVRHPMYLAALIIIWLRSLTLAGIITNTILTLYIIIGVFLEERKLVREFGSEYIEYQKEVPMLIPFIKYYSLGLLPLFRTKK